MSTLRTTQEPRRDFERRPFDERFDRRRFRRFFRRRPFRRFFRRFFRRRPWDEDPWDGGDWGGDPDWGMPWGDGSWDDPDCCMPVDIAPIWSCLVNPIVCHGLMQLQAGAPPEHVIRQCATMGVLTGMGTPPEAAIAAVEQWEHMMACEPMPCPGI